MDVPRFEAGSNTFTVVLLVVERDKKGTQCLGYNWDTLFLGDINTGTSPSRFGESRIWDSKIWSWVPWYSDPRMTTLARASSNFKRQNRSLVRQDAPDQQTHNSLTVIKTDLGPQIGCLTPRQTGQLTVGRDITLTSRKANAQAFFQTKQQHR
jgi:hypothetical protein